MDALDGQIHRTQLNDLVTQRLREAILDGSIQPGAWLRQRKIAAELGVSQMPVREALKQLAAEGLVEHVPYRGVRAISFSRQAVADLYAHRAFLEGRAARAAAQHITSENLEELRRLQEEMRANLSVQALPEYRRLNRSFHQIIYHASQRDYLVRALDQLWSSFPLMLLNNFPQTSDAVLPKRDTSDADEHEAILMALESGDQDSAARLVRRHIEGACQEFVSALECEEEPDNA
jgi:DNA-binding GntR family transcriptional regulator